MGLGDESQMHADAAGDRPGKNVCDPGMRNSQELSAGIKLICRPQAKACKHTARTARVAEIGLPLPHFLSSPLLKVALLLHLLTVLWLFVFFASISIFSAFVFLSPAVLPFAQICHPSPFTFSFPPNLPFLSSLSLA